MSMARVLLSICAKNTISPAGTGTIIFLTIWFGRQMAISASKKTVSLIIIPRTPVRKDIGSSWKSRTPARSGTSAFYRFSSEDCRFEERLSDDIAAFFGNDTSAFEADRLMADREFQLYDHQVLTLEEIRDRRRQGIHTFLAVFPTTSGKSKIVEQDLYDYLIENLDARVLIMAPTKNIVADWKTRTAISLNGFAYRIDIHKNSFLARNYHQLQPDQFEEKYGDYLNQEQVTRAFFMSTGSIISWVKKGRIQADYTIQFGSKKIYLFSPDHVQEIKAENSIPDHDANTIRKDFFDFLAERDYSLSYKMPFMLAFVKNLDSSGDANVDMVLRDYISFYQDRIEKGLPVDRKTCPYTKDTLQDLKFVKRNMLTNPFEKFERKRFIYYSKDLNTLSMNRALFTKLTEDDYKAVTSQMREDLKDYYSKL